MAAGAFRGAFARRLVIAARVWACGMIVGGAGCGGPQTTVKGVVTLEGNPLNKAIVQFWPEQGSASTAVAVTDGQGRFATVLDPVAFRVTIVAEVVDGKQANPDDPKGPPVDRYTSLVPKLYSDAATTPLRVESISGQSTVADFDLLQTTPSP